MDPGNDTAQLIDGLVKGDRRLLSKAITLVESQLPSDKKRKFRLMQSIQPHRDLTVRIGITGSPGVGKSTFLNGFGQLFKNTSFNIAILTIDPSSSGTGGSILGDKIRMKELSEMDQVYIRPSPSKGVLGGVNLTTWETVQLCEAAGFDFIFIETVGIGQSEIEVRNLVNETWYLTMAQSGDEIQGIKRGILEEVDRIIITKADLDPDGAKQTMAMMRQSLKTMQSRSEEPSFYQLSPFRPESMASLYEDVISLESKPLDPDQIRFWFHRGREETIQRWIQNDTRLGIQSKILLQQVLNGETDHWSAMTKLENELEKLWRK